MISWQPLDGGGAEVQFAYMDGHTAWCHLSERAIGTVDLREVAAAARQRPPKLLSRTQQAERASQVQH